MGREGMLFFKFGRGLWTNKKTAPKNNCAFVDDVVKFCEILICPTFREQGIYIKKVSLISVCPFVT